jgi:peptidyl-dipeptidase Dcp
MLARHRSETYLNEVLFKRIDALKADQDKLGLSTEQVRVLDRYHLDFTRAGAGASPEAWARLVAIAERLATLAAQFGQNVLADEKAWLMLLDKPDLDGLPDFFIVSAARVAADRGHPGKYAITLSRSSIEPFLQFSARRDLRETAFRAWAARGENGGATDNRAIAAEMVRLRAERARGSWATRPPPTTASPTRWPGRRGRRWICSSRSGRRASPARGRMRRRCRRLPLARAAISKSRPGIGAT